MRKRTNCTNENTLWLFCHEMQNIIFIIYMLWNFKGLTCSLFSWNLRHNDFVNNNHTILNKLLLRLYASMNCVTSQFTIDPFSAHTLTRVCHFSKQSTTHRPTSHFSYLVNTHDVFASLWMTSVANVSHLVDSVGPQMNLTSLEKCHWPWYSPRCVCTIKPRTRILRNFLCVIFPHDLCNK
jgi:hypothetical protein